MNDQKLEEMIGESVWDTYRNMAYLLSEVTSALVKKVAGAEKRKWAGKMGENPWAGKHYGDALDKQRKLEARLKKRRVEKTATRDLEDVDQPGDK